MPLAQRAHASAGRSSSGATASSIAAGVMSGSSPWTFTMMSRLERRGDFGEPIGARGVIGAASSPRCRRTRPRRARLRSSSVATTTASTRRACAARGQTCSTIGLAVDERERLAGKTRRPISSGNDGDDSGVNGGNVPVLTGKRRARQILARVRLRSGSFDPGGTISSAARPDMNRRCVDLVGAGGVLSSRAVVAPAAPSPLSTDLRTPTRSIKPAPLVAEMARAGRAAARVASSDAAGVSRRRRAIRSRFGARREAAPTRPPSSRGRARGAATAARAGAAEAASPSSRTTSTASSSRRPCSPSATT